MYYIMADAEEGATLTHGGRPVVILEVFEDDKGMAWAKCADLRTKAPLLIPCQKSYKGPEWDWKLTREGSEDYAIVHGKTRAEIREYLDGSKEWDHADRISGTHKTRETLEETR